MIAMIMMDIPMMMRMMMMVMIFIILKQWIVFFARSDWLFKVGISSAIH